MTIQVDLQISEHEKKAFEAGFRAGFSISFDGWNGQVFNEFNRPLEESKEFMNLLNKLRAHFEEQVREQSNLLSFTVHSEGHSESYSLDTTGNAVMR